MGSDEDDRKKAKNEIRSDFEKLKEVIVLLSANELENLHRALRSEAVGLIVRALLGL